MRFTKQVLRVVVVATLCTGSLKADQLLVPGTANPWLAGATNGTTAAGGDVAPSESPALFTNFVAGSAVYFSATGSAGYNAGSESGPDGVPGYYVNHGVENGIGALNNAQANALLGVFLDDTVPSGPTPDPLDFGPAGLQDYSTISPALKQPFVIGSGFETNGLQHSIVVPSGAKRLFLGICDGSGWYNNTGSFTVDVTLSTAPPIRLISGDGKFEVHWPAAYSNCIVQMNTNVQTTNWVSLTNAATVVGPDLVLTNSGGASRAFFRLQCH